LSLREAANNLKLTLRPRGRVFQPAANECEGARQEGKLGKIEQLVGERLRKFLKLPKSGKIALSDKLLAAIILMK
jgi:hypothetical protein